MLAQMEKEDEGTGRTLQRRVPPSSVESYAIVDTWLCLPTNNRLKYLIISFLV